MITFGIALRGWVEESRSYVGTELLGRFLCLRIPFLPGFYLTLSSVDQTF